MTESTELQHRMAEDLAYNGAEHRAVEAALKRGRVLGKGATVEQQLRLAALAPESLVRVVHTRYNDKLTFHAGHLDEFSKLVVSPNGGRTAVGIYLGGDLGDQHNVVWGHAICHERDNFRKRLGVHIALARALERLEAKRLADDGGYP